MSNKLAQETSPYLLQHADNPVEWYPWGEEAFAKAKAENKPILLSIGYAACHWCHVMAHESFEDDDTAELMNRHFINIKVDREERPDVDQIYMNAVVAMTRQGGWPLTAALTPDGKPFWGGTYYPPTPRQGMPSFQQVLLSLNNAWETDREKISTSAEGITEHISRAFGLFGDGERLSKEMLYKSLSNLANQFDPKWGGFGQAPKFPQPMNLEFVLRGYLATNDPNVLHLAEHTLNMMAQGGMYDHIGGGFARYSTDVKWLVPHFEKMLYDNGLLARVYLHAWQITKRPLYKKVVEEILDYTLKEMTHEQGGFYSSQDADSEGVEGKFYVWSQEEIDDILGEDSFVFCTYYDITRNGNWEGNNIPNMTRSHEEVARLLKVDEELLHKIISRSKEKMYAARSQRVWPGLDDKVLTAWNGLMLAAFAEAGRVLGREDYTRAAVNNAEFLYNNMRDENGRLLRTWRDNGAGHKAKYNGYLEDYAFLADGLLTLYQATFDERWFAWSQELGEMMITHFVDNEQGGFYDTSDDHEALIFRPKDVQDNAIPSGNAAASLVLLQLSLYTGNGRYWDIAEKAVSAMAGAMEQYPNGFGHWLTAGTVVVEDNLEIAIIGDPHQADTQALLATAFASYRPYNVVAVGTDGDVIELLAQRPQVDGKATAYVCQRFACQVPTGDTAVLAEQIG